MYIYQDAKGNKILSQVSKDDLQEDGSFIVPEEVTMIDAYCFNSLQELTKVEISNNVKEIGICAFLNCKNLAMVAMKHEGNLTRIHERAFYNCSSLNAVYLSDNLKRIGMYAFSGCSALTTARIPAGLEEFGSPMFSECKILNRVFVRTPEKLENLNEVEEIVNLKNSKQPTKNIEKIK